VENEEIPAGMVVEELTVPVRNGTDNMIIGVDISHYDNGANLDIIRPNCDFIILKAYDGIDMAPDPDFEANYAKSVSLGFPVIEAYMYICCAAGHDADEQREDFYAIVKDKPYIKRLWVDLETRGNDGLNGFPVISHDKIGSRAEKTCRLLKAEGTHRVGVYTNLGFIQEFMTSYPQYPPVRYYDWMKDYDLWLSQWTQTTKLGHITMDWQTFINTKLPTKPPSLAFNGVTVQQPIYQQFTGEVFELPGHAVGSNGIGQALDVNIFMGTKEEFDKLSTIYETPIPIELSDPDKLKIIWEWFVKEHPELVK
jgi:hypothetical protein